MKNYRWLTLPIIIFFFFSLTVTAPAQASENEKELFLVAQKAFEDGFYDVSIRYIKQLIKDYPKSEKLIQAKLLLGQCYFFMSQYLQAFDIFQDLLQYSEYKDATLFWMGETYLKGSDFKKAEEQYKTLLELYLDSIYAPQALYSLGWIYYEQNDFINAKGIFMKLIRKYPLHQLSEDASFKLGEIEYNLHNYDNTIQFFENYITKFPHSTRQPEAFFYIGESYYYLQQYLPAITYYAKTAELSYDNKLKLMSKVSLGWGYLKLEKFQLAQEHFDQALRFAEEKGILSDDVYLGQANLYSEMGEHKKALQAYSELIQNFPKSKRIFEAYLGRANMYYALEIYPQAIRAYQNLIDGLPEHKQNPELVEKAFFGMAWSYLKAGNIDAAVTTFESIKDKAGNNIVRVSALTQIGDAYQEIGELEKALQIYDNILTGYPDSAYADYVQFRQGITLLKMDKMDSATLSFQSLRVNFPKSKYIKDSNYYLAVAYYKKGDWQLALENIQKFTHDLMETNELLGEAKYIEALCQFNLNQSNEAIKTFSYIVKNFPDQTKLVQDAKLGIAKSYYNAGNTNEAIKRFQSIAKQQPESENALEAMIWLGDHYLGFSEYDNAISYYEQSVEHFSGDEKIHLIYYNLGLAYQAKEQYDLAIEMFKRIKPTNDPELLTKAKLAIADIFSRELDPDSAIQTYENIIETSPEFKRDAYVKIADMHKANKKFQRSIEAYQKAMQAEKGLSTIKDVELQFYIGDALELLNQPEKALEAYFKIPYLYPREKQWAVKAYLRNARIYEDEEKWDEAKMIYKKIVEMKADELVFAKERLDWIENNTPAK